MNGKTRYRILLVDDDARLRELLSRYLQEQGFAVKAVGDAPTMDRALHREHFDLMVLDLMLREVTVTLYCRWMVPVGGSYRLAWTSKNLMDFSWLIKYYFIVSLPVHH